MAEQLRDPEQGDVAELGAHDGDLGVGIEFEPAVQLGQDLRPAAAGGPDQEDPAELLLVRPVARPPAPRRAPGRRRRWRPARLREALRGALALGLLTDPRVIGQRLVDLVGAERGGRGPGLLEQLVQRRYGPAAITSSTQRGTARQAVSPSRSSSVVRSSCVLIANDSPSCVGPTCSPTGSARSSLSTTCSGLRRRAPSVGFPRATTRFVSWHFRSGPSPPTSTSPSTRTQPAVSFLQTPAWGR